MLLNLTHADLLILKEQRLDRFRSFFNDSLPFCILDLNSQNELFIDCSEPWLVDLLLLEVDQLRWYAWVVVGAYQLSIHYAQEEIYVTATRPFIERSQPSIDSPAFN